MRSVLKIITGSVLALSLSAGIALAQAKSKVTIAVGGGACLCYLPTMLAKALGEYDKAGLDVELVDLKGGSQALAAVMGGSADVVSGYYDHCVNLAAKGQSENQLRFAVLTQLLRLRQISCDPRLVPAGRTATAADSAKLDVFRELLAESIDEGHRMLVFSQFTSLLGLLREAGHNLAEFRVEHRETIATPNSSLQSTLCRFPCYRRV